MYYQGDMSASMAPDFRTSHFSLGLDVGYQLNRIIKINLGYVRGKISGADSLVAGHEKRNLHFVSPISDLRLLTYIDVYAIYDKIWPNSLLEGEYGGRKFTGPNLIFGIGYTKFNPKGYSDGEWHKLQELGTEGQHIQGGNYPEPYNRWAFNVKYGLSFGHKLTKQINLELEFIYHNVFTDYLDDLSGTYPDYNKLIASEKGDLAAYFTYGGRDGSVVREGQLRGNPDSKDSFVSFGFKLSYIIGKKDLEYFKNL
jgi:hypothetical protein